jgi:hypothetical protein
MDIKHFAFILLLFRLGAVAFILLVIYKQLRLMRLPLPRGVKKSKDKNVRIVRYILFALSLIILFNQFVPIVIDILTITSDLKRSTTQVNSIGILYALSNSMGAIFSAFTIWLLYKLASRE